MLRQLELIKYRKNNPFKLPIGVIIKDCSEEQRKEFAGILKKHEFIWRRTHRVPHEKHFNSITRVNIRNNKHISHCSNISCKSCKDRIREKCKGDEMEVLEVNGILPELDTLLKENNGILKKSDEVRMGDD